MRSALIVAFDGLQPAQIAPSLAPNLAAFAEQGVVFDNHHAVYPSVTRVNAASIATGRYPGAHGLAANVVAMRDYHPHNAFSAMQPTLAAVARKTAALLSPTLADLLHRHGREYIAVGTGTSGNAYVHNPNAERGGGATIHPEFCLPDALHADIAARFGEWPPEGVTNAAKLEHAVTILTEYVLGERKPAVACVWFSEPDHAQHAHGVGSAVGLRALREADAQFGRLLAWLEDSGAAANTDVLVVSDHGYSTIGEVIDIEALVRAAGFPPGNQAGGITVATNGGSALFYAHNSDAATTDRLAAWLMRQRWCGALVASDAAGAIAGTLPAALVGAEGQRAPDLAMSFRWDSRANAAGYNGYAFSTGGAPELGQHGSMSRHEMRNVLIARGKRFRSGARIQSPTGNTDIAPTILHLLGIDGGAAMDGRILIEALADGADSVEWRTHTHRAERRLPDGVYRQRIAISSVGATTYVDEGNGGLE